MSVDAIRCPNCGGDIDLDAKVCPYCGSDIICDGFEKRKSDITKMLMSARNDITSGRYKECLSHVEDIISLDPDCADAWFMSAALHGTDRASYERDMKRARSCTSKYGIFGEDDVTDMMKTADRIAIKGIRFVFIFFGIMVLFFGGFISLGLGLAFGTFIPAIITLCVAVVIILIYVLVTSKYRK